MGRCWIIKWKVQGRAGDWAATETADNVWASDHFAVVAELKM